MIIAKQEDNRLLVTTQTDHAAFSAELLSLWRGDDLPANPRRERLLFAAREHDNGWQEADSSPRRRADGRPHDFLSVPGEVRREIWARGVFRHAVKRPWAALLILEHALNLHRRHREDGDWKDLIGAWLELRAELLAAVTEGDGVDRGADMGEAELAADYRFLDTADTLSLAVCAGWSGRREYGDVRYLANLGEQGAELQIEPFPLAGATTFTLACRSIEDIPYASDVDLAMALATARWRRLPIRVSPFREGISAHSVE